MHHNKKCLNFCVVLSGPGAPQQEMSQFLCRFIRPGCTTTRNVSIFVSFYQARVHHNKKYFSIFVSFYQARVHHNKKYFSIFVQLNISLTWIFLQQALAVSTCDEYFGQTVPGNFSHPSSLLHIFPPPPSPPPPPLFLSVCSENQKKILILWSACLSVCQSVSPSVSSLSLSVSLSLCLCLCLCLSLSLSLSPSSSPPPSLSPCHCVWRIQTKFR